jgi:hypothetical protein
MEYPIHGDYGHINEQLMVTSRGAEKIGDWSDGLELRLLYGTKIHPQSKGVRLNEAQIRKLRDHLNEWLGFDLEDEIEKRLENTHEERDLD